MLPDVQKSAVIPSNICISLLPDTKNSEPLIIKAFSQLGNK
jgi:hypothetical protein